MGGPSGQGIGRGAFDVLGDAQNAADLGRDFGATLTEREAKWLVDKEFACHPR